MLDESPASLSGSDDQNTNLDVNMEREDKMNGQEFEEYIETDEVKEAMFDLTHAIGIESFGCCQLDFNYDEEYSEFYLTAIMNERTNWNGDTDSCYVCLFVLDDTALDATFLIKSVVPTMIEWVKEYRQQHNDAPILPWIVIDQFPYHLHFDDNLQPVMTK